jgi:glycosyltransferase involved in cell wall biosynthesis
MSIREIRSNNPPMAERLGGIAALAPRRERLAIVSTRNKLCGIAAYTQALERHLADTYDLRVFDLDQYLLRSRHPRVRTTGDRHIKDICREIAGFDAVNLQLEYGTLGSSANDIYRRLSWLVNAAPRLSVTFHTLVRPPVFPIAEFVKAILTLKWRSAGEMTAAFSRNRKLSLEIPKLLRRVQRRKPLSAIVHNRRDLAEASHLHGFGQVFDHPLSFLSQDEINAVRSQATRSRFTLLDTLPADAILIGAFGFLNDYKGFGTAVRALHHLSDNHHLLIFGGTHPNEIPVQKAIHPYVASLLDAANVDSTVYDQLRGATGLGLTLDIERHLVELFGAHPRDLSNRLHFMGALEDADFLAGMAICDVVVFPYLEVGQSASGPIAQAVELGCRIVASRTHSFLQFAAYHPETIEFFDIGNHLELAKRIGARRQYAARHEQLRYDIESNKVIYLAANSPANSGSRFRRRQSGATRQAVRAER